MTKFKMKIEQEGLNITKIKTDNIQDLEDEIKKLKIKYK